ncbi:MAG: ATP-binding cassette domain-containing protein, partial [Desemzia incerta]
PKNPLMKDISVRVNPGEMVAIVGPTGAGKTTLVNLLMRFYDVDGGSIKVDGVDIKKITRSDLRKHFGMVLQDAWLYQDTVMENLRFGKLEATDEEVIHAAEIANVNHFIQTLPNGYGMEINQEASNISLGQKQLMTIARTVLSDPDILILDEATSSVDTRLEKLIQEAMDKVMEGRTSFVIAHRLSTIRNADLILVMDQGSIIEQGTHDSLLEQGGFYANLYNSQFSETAAE